MKKLKILGTVIISALLTSACYQTSPNYSSTPNYGSTGSYYYDGRYQDNRYNTRHDYSRQHNNNCSNVKGTIGTVVGGVAGGVLGNQIGRGSGRTIATIGGAVLGGVVGNAIGNSMDRQDCYEIERQRERVLYAPVGHREYYRNNHNGNVVESRSLRDYRSRNGEYCREYQTTIIVQGRREQAYGQACQNRDGTWEIIN